MKNNFLKFFGILFLFGGLMFMTSCSDDDGVVIDPGSGLNVSNGWYLAISGEDPMANGGLAAEVVEDEGFGSKERSGFVAGYIYLSAGDYQLVQVAEVDGERQVVTTIGGTAATESDMASGCDYNDYTVVTAAEDGPAITVANAGLYRVTYDVMRSEMILYQIQQASLIGGATPNGWGEDTPLTGSVDADGATWTLNDVVMRAGEYKVRFNCRWNLDRRIDPNAAMPFEDANGYMFFTNFGKSPDDLETGGANMIIDAPGSGGSYEEGTYDVELSWDPRDGFALNKTRTGDAPVLTFDPADYVFGVIGSAAAEGWDGDRKMFYKGIVDGAHAWYGVFTFTDAMGDEVFKLRTNELWDFNLGGTLAADGMETTLEIGGVGNDFASPGSGAYYIELKTADEGDTWTATMYDAGWGVIGQGSPSMGWDTDTPMTAEGFDAGISTYTVTGDFTTDEWKIRAGGMWDYSLGGSIDALEEDVPGNLTLPEAGTYKITLTYDGETYSAEAEKQ